MSKIFAAMEFLWFTIAIVALVLSVTAFVKKDMEQGAYLIGIVVLSMLMFWNRRRQRMNLKKE